MCAFVSSKCVNVCVCVFVRLVWASVLAAEAHFLRKQAHLIGSTNWPITNHGTQNPKYHPCSPEHLPQTETVHGSRVRGSACVEERRIGGSLSSWIEMSLG